MTMSISHLEYILMYRHGPRTGGPELLAEPLLALFCRCVPARCQGRTRVLVKIHIRSLIYATGSHQNGKHLLGSGSGPIESR